MEAYPSEVLGCLRKRLFFLRAAKPFEPEVLMSSGGVLARIERGVLDSGDPVP
jgi:hypothetical protein